MDISVSNTNSTRRSSMDMARAVFDGYYAPSTKDAEHSRHVASSREVLIEGNIHVSMSQQELLGGILRTKCASLPYSHRIWKLLVLRCIMRPRMLIG